MSFYDEFRWSDINNYNLINFFRNNLDNDTKILTHWLCYVVDRQMAFKIIWDVGGFVISELIAFTKMEKTLILLNPSNPDSFLKREYNGDKYFFMSRSAANEKIIEDYENYVQNGKVKFKSRFFPSDYLSILYTFSILKEYDFTFSKYLRDIYLKNKQKDDFLQRILFGLYLLTYFQINQPSSNDLANFEQNIAKAEDRKNKIFTILNDSNLFENEFDKFKKSNIFKQKRAWCSLRDFLKSPEFKGYFENALRTEGLVDDDFNQLFSSSTLTQLELPGDVWNNNSKFRKCLLKNTEYENSKTPLNKILRKYYDKNINLIEGYPEQFDISFDFVPRMCEQNNCNICPLYKLDNLKNDFNKICFKDENMFCPVVLIGCNYKNNCVGESNCKIA